MEKTIIFKKTPPPKKNEIIIRKNSALIQNKTFELNSTQRKIINACIYIAQQQKFNSETMCFKTDIKTMQNLVGSKKHDKTSFQKSVTELVNTRITFNYLEKDSDISHWRSMAILSDIDIASDGKIIFEFPTKIRENILKPEIYTPINLTLIKKFKSSYAIILYEFLRDYLYIPKNAIFNYIPTIPKLTILQIRDLLGVKNGQYSSMADFRKRVLNPAIKEINEKTQSEITCYYNLEKINGNGNQYEYIQLFAQNKEKELPKNIY